MATSTTTQSFEPSALFAPYLQSSAQSLQNVATQPYQAFQGPRVAGLSPLETQGFNTAANYQLPGQFQTAGNAYNTGINSLFNSAGAAPQTYQAGSFSAGFNPTTFSSGYSGPGSAFQNVANFQANQTFGGTFGTPEAQQYMSPYQQGVTDIAKRETERDFQKQQSQLRARMGAAGAFGGSRATLLETENQRNQNQLLSDIQTKGLQDAYTNAQQMFGQDRAARLQAFGLNEDARRNAAQLGLGALTAQESARQQAGQMGMEAQRLGEQSRQFGATQGLDAFRANEAAKQAQGAQNLEGRQLQQSALAQALQGAQGLGTLGTQIGAEERARINQLSDLGLQQRAQQQAILDRDYEMYKDARDYGLQRAGAFAQGLGSIAGRYGTQSTTQDQQSSTLANLAATAGILGTLGGDAGATGGLDFLKGLVPNFISNLFKDNA